MKKLFLICLVLGSLQAKFNIQVAYHIKVPEKSIWGISVAKGVSNHAGVAGIIEGQGPGCLLCPSMEYGVTAWNANVNKQYYCSDADKKKALSAQQSSAKSCGSIKKAVGQTADYTAAFQKAKTFFGIIEKSVASLVNAFPDYSQGQGYQSTDYIKFCAGGASVINVTTQLEQAQQAVSAVGDVSGYFPNNQFVISLDFTTLAMAEPKTKLPTDK